jgi:hypothetical protein
VAYGVNLMALQRALAAQWPPAAAQAIALVCYQVIFFLLLRFAVFRTTRLRSRRYACRASSALDIGRFLLHGNCSRPLAPFCWGRLPPVSSICPTPPVGSRSGCDCPTTRCSAFYTQSFKLIPNMPVDFGDFPWGGWSALNGR